MKWDQPTTRRFPAADEKPGRDVRLQHPAADESWPPRPVDRTPPRAPTSEHPINRHLEWADRRIGWIWKLGGVVVACVAFGWAAHAQVMAWTSHLQTIEGAELDRERVRKLEGFREGDVLQLRKLEADLLRLRQDFDAYRATHPDPPKGQPHDLPGRPRMP